MADGRFQDSCTKLSSDPKNATDMLHWTGQARLEMVRTKLKTKFLCIARVPAPDLGTCLSICGPHNLIVSCHPSIGSFLDPANCFNAIVSNIVKYSEPLYDASDSA